MNLKLNDVVIGKFYCNVQVSRKSLPESYPNFMVKLKAGEVTFELDKVKMTIKSFRKCYSDEENIYVEGSELSFE